MAAMTHGSTKGNVLAAPSGRAHDFSWPRGAVNVELAAPEPAVYDMPADGSAKQAKRAENRSASAEQLRRLLRSAQGDPVLCFF
jgi:hypothetical protein